MLGKNLIQAAAGAAGGEETDEYFQNTTLLLHGDGTQGNQNNTFLDSSTNNFTITRAGNTTQGSFSPFSKPDGRWGNYFDGSTASLDTPSNAAFAMGTGDFTIQFFLYAQNLTSVPIIVDLRPAGTNGNYPMIYYNGSNLIYYVNSGARITGSSLSNNTFYHIAVSRISGSTRLFIDGVQSGSTWADSTNYAQSKVRIAASGYDGANKLSGYLSNLRIEKGNGYSSITVPTSPLTAISGTSLLTCQSNRFVDNSTNSFAITVNGSPKVTPFSPLPITTEYSPSVNGGSGYFDGNGDYLVTASNVNALGTGDFTFETWVYPTSISNFKYLFSINGDNNFSLVLDNNSYTPYFYVGAVIILSSKALIGNQWNHVALVRNGGGSNNLTMYVNGESGGSATFTANITAGLATISARAAGTPYFLQGYQSGLRVTSNAIYTSAFTPPSTPPTAISGTELLLNFTNAGIYDSTGSNNLETVGNAQVDTNTVKYGTGAMKFDGSGDYLNLAPSEQLAFGTGAFTIEAWIYLNVTNTYQTLFESRTTGGDTSGMTFQVTNTGTMQFYSGSGITTTTTISANTWTHVALVCEGTGTNETKIYINGVSSATGTKTNNLTRTSVDIGKTFDNFYFNGYIDDLRITKGVARYTSNFTVPDKALPNIGV